MRDVNFQKSNVCGEGAVSRTSEDLDPVYCEHESQVIVGQMVNKKRQYRCSNPLILEKMPRQTQSGRTLKAGQ